MCRTRNLAVILSLLLSTSALADEFSDFRIPEHRIFVWNGSLAGSINRNNQSLVTGNVKDIQRFTTFTTQGLWLHDSDPARTQISFLTSFDGERDRQERSQDIIGGPTGHVNQNFYFTSATERWQLSASHRGYPWSVPIGWEVGVSSSGGYSQRWDGRDLTQRLDNGIQTQGRLETEDRSIWRYSYTVDASAMLGFGRVRDATAVFDVRVFEARLLRAGALVRALSPQARERLARLAYVQYGYGNVHERSAKYVWQHVERLLREDGALSDSAWAPAAAFLAAEPFLFGGSGSFIARSPIARFKGGFVGVIAVPTHFHDLARSDGNAFARYFVDDSLVTTSQFHSGFRFDRDISQTMFGGRGEYHLPIGPRLQLDTDAQVEIPLHEREEGLDVLANARLDAIVADRWVAGVRAGFERLIIDSDGFQPLPSTDAWWVQYSVYLSVYLEDRLQLSLGADERQTHESQSRRTGFGGRRFDRSGRVYVGLSYRFLGRFDAPGIVTPQRIGVPAF